MGGRQLEYKIRILQTKLSSLNFSDLFIAHAPEPDSHQVPIRVPVISKEIVHWVTSVYPYADFNRSLFEIRPVSTFVAELIWNAIAAKEQSNHVNLFHKLLKAEDLPAKMLAAYYYDTQYHRYFCSAPSLPAYPMSPASKLSNNNTTR